MTMVVGFAPDGRGRAVLHLAAMLARSGAEELLVCAVVPAPWPPSPAKVDAEYQAALRGAAENALSRARARLPADVPASFEVLQARSAPAGLIDVAERVSASLIVVGSAVEGGSGMVAVGSTSARLLHSSHVPIALAPRGFKVPLYPLVPIASIGGCIWIIKDLRAVTIYVFLIWTTVALAWYFLYGIRNSKLGRAKS